MDIIYWITIVSWTSVCIESGTKGRSSYMDNNVLASQCKTV